LQAPLVPASVLRARRTELDAVPLSVVEGQLPPDLAGHLFVVAPVGTVATGGLPYPRPTTIMNGDGMVFRVDFGGGAAHVTSRLVRTWDQRADALTHEDDTLAALRFTTAGIARIGLLGARNFANTAFQPFLGADGKPRLLVTYDAGRPWELDPQTLETITPVGARDEWRASALGPLPFPLFLSPAHPAFDPATGELFTANYVRSPASLLGLSASGLFAGLPALLRKPLAMALDGLGDLLEGDAFASLVVKLRELGIADALRTHVLEHVAPEAVSGCDVLRWDGEGKLARTRLVLADGSPVTIRQSIHQVAVTSAHVVLLDTGFKLGAAQLLNDPLPGEEQLDAVLRALLDEPQMTDTIFYVVPRAALSDGGIATAVRVVIPVESDHFVADYDEDAGRITVHVGHAPATDLAEWVRPYDKNHYTGAPGPAYAGGFLAVGAMDVGRLGRYAFDARTGQVVDSAVLADDQKLWAISLYAGEGFGGTDALPERIRSIFWGTEGAFPDLLTRYVYDLYKAYPHRVTPLANIAKLAAQGGRPACIVRLDTQSMTLADALVLPSGTMVSSLQFVARPGAQPGRDDGWLLCMVFTQERPELWILDARNLSAPPCKLASDSLVVGFSLHAAWLPSLAPRTSRYAVPIDDEMMPGQHAPDLEAFLATKLVPEFRGR
jgi:carotenoid cleavage dioxygenase-like enzyme